MQLEPGFIYAIAGENGAGKSTLFHLILSNECVYSGEMKLGEIDLASDRVKALNHIAFISEDIRPLPAASNIGQARIMGSLYDDFDEELFVATMKKMGLSTGKTYANQSRGEKIKYQIAFGVACHAKLFLMDEATAGMDPVFRIDFFNMLRELLIQEDCCILMTSHNMTEICKQTDYVAIMQDGELGEFQESIDF